MWIQLFFYKLVGFGYEEKRRQGVRALSPSPSLPPATAPQEETDILAVRRLLGLLSAYAHLRARDWLQDSKWPRVTCPP